MKKIGLFYGTTGGKTIGIVDEINFYLKDQLKIYNVDNGVKEIKKYENIILVSPTYGFGELEPHWKRVINEFKKIDVSNKIVALVCLGSQTTFGESFVGALKILYDIVVKNGGTVIGLTSIKGYFFEECNSIIDHKFMGLVIDEENQDDQTPDRIYNWIEDIKLKFM